MNPNFSSGTQFNTWLGYKAPDGSWDGSIVAGTDTDVPLPIGSAAAPASGAGTASATGSAVGDGYNLHYGYGSATATGSAVGQGYNLHYGYGSATGVGSAVGDGYRLSYGYGVVNALATAYGEGAISATTTASSPPSGVRRSRFLRRGPRLPGYDPEDPVEVLADVPRETPTRKRVRAPLIQHEKLPDFGVPIQAQSVPTATRIYVPGVGTAVLAEIDDEEEAVLMALLQ